VDYLCRWPTAHPSVKPLWIPPWTELGKAAFAFVRTAVLSRWFLQTKFKVVLANPQRTLITAEAKIKNDRMRAY
jgi:hypothetical protein